MHTATTEKILFALPNCNFQNYNCKLQFSGISPQSKPFELPRNISGGNNFTSPGWGYRLRWDESDHCGGEEGSLQTLCCALMSKYFTI